MKIRLVYEDGTHDDVDATDEVIDAGVVKHGGQFFRYVSEVRRVTIPAFMQAKVYDAGAAKKLSTPTFADIARRLHASSERAQNIRDVPMRLVHQDVFDELMSAVDPYHKVPEEIRHTSCLDNETTHLHAVHQQKMKGVRDAAITDDDLKHMSSGDGGEVRQMSNGRISRHLHHDINVLMTHGQAEMLSAQLGTTTTRSPHHLITMLYRLLTAATSGNQHSSIHYSTGVSITYVDLRKES